jgi:CheY-like chemotaxis protein
VDDILTLSKLDSNLLEVSPEIVQPIALIQRAIRMYDAELQSADIEINVSIDPPYEDLSIDTVLVDPSRVLQVLINLLTNAIKFTQARQQRSITIYLSASLSRPSVGTHNVSYIPQRASRPEHVLSPDWGTGEDIYLQYAVEDTGRGLSEEEMKLLFLRFSQTSPKTHSQYGGSGLGLFISRELTELQGGQIGVSSVPGYGTTFTFYIKARRYIPTKEETAEDSSKEVSRLGVSEENPAEFVKPNAPLSILDNRRQSVTLSRSELEAAVAPLTTPLTRSSSAKYMHVLLVEDNFINQKVMAQQLRRFGCVVYVANNGLEALDVLQQSHFATSPHPPAAEIKKRGSFATTEQVGLGIQRRSSKGTMIWPIPLSVLLMDLEMPVMDGLSCVRRIREMQQDGELRAHVPVIAVTANARSEQIAVAMQTGMVSARPFARFVTSGGWRKTSPLKPLRCFISTGLNRIWNRNHTDTTLLGPCSNKAIPNTGSASADRSIGASA